MKAGFASPWRAPLSCAKGTTREALCLPATARSPLTNAAGLMARRILDADQAIEPRAVKKLTAY